MAKDPKRTVTMSGVRADWEQQDRQVSVETFDLDQFIAAYDRSTDTTRQTLVQLEYNEADNVSTRKDNARTRWVVVLAVLAGALAVQLSNAEVRSEVRGMREDAAGIRSEIASSFAKMRTDLRTVTASATATNEATLAVAIADAEEPTEPARGRARVITVELTPMQ